MTHTQSLGRIAFALIVLVGMTVSAQTADPGAFDAKKFEDQGRQLLEQLQQPGVDQQQIMQQVGQLMQQFREQTAGMSQDQIDQIRQQMMLHLQPLIIKSMPTIMQRMREGFVGRLKEQLGCTDEEFTAIKPGLQKVLDCMQALTVAPRGGRGGFGGMAMGMPQSPLAQAMAELQSTLDDPDAHADTIASKIEAVRKAKTAAIHDLDVARAELRPLLTVRQESVLVTSGLLE